MSDQNHTNDGPNSDLIEVEKIQDITVPPGALTTCPARRYALVSIAGVCHGCEYSLGLWEVTLDDVPFADKYRVKCGVPQVREITMFQMGGD